MPASKIQDHQEVRRWFEEGRTYSWMVQKYMEKYHIETSISMWGSYRARHGLETRLVREHELWPWEIAKEHRNSYIFAMLRQEARRREGLPLTKGYEARLDSWLEQVRELDVVVHYDAETEEGFFLVPREPGDDDLIREPR